MTLINANNYATYDKAWDVYYNGVVPKYGATRMEWGFCRWLYIPHQQTTGDDTLAYWELLDSIGILTADGRKRLARAQKTKYAIRGGVLNEQETRPGEARGRAHGSDRQVRADRAAEDGGADDVAHPVACEADRARGAEEGGASCQRP